MEALKSPVPEILVSLAPPEDPVPEPYSPFPTTPVDNGDDYRCQHLTPPPASPMHRRELSPLRPAEAPVKGKGLDRERFEAMLKASKERNAALGNNKRSPDLRKEIALKAHKSKQMERRALFLSKINAPPSPTAVSLPKTPPESPAIFHYTLPSPGLVSPLQVFGSLHIDEDGNQSVSDSPRKSWVERVDFTLPRDSSEPGYVGRVVIVDPPQRLFVAKPLPSLDQITAHITSLRFNPPQPIDMPPVRPPSTRLPAFLRSKQSTSFAHSGFLDKGAEVPQGFPDAIVHAKKSHKSLTTSTPPQTPLCIVSPPSPQSPTYLETAPADASTVPFSLSKTAPKLSEQSMRDFSRARARSGMFATLRRRTLVMAEHGQADLAPQEGSERKGRRSSAPPRLQAHGRVGFLHPVLSIPGGF